MEYNAQNVGPPGVLFCRNKGLIRPCSEKTMVNKPLLNKPLNLWGGSGLVDQPEKMQSFGDFLKSVLIGWVPTYIALYIF